jgi:hypothetical protein
MDFYYVVVAGQFEYIHATKKTKISDIKVGIMKEMYPIAYKGMKPEKLVKLTKLVNLNDNTASININVDTSYGVS